MRKKQLLVDKWIKHRGNTKGFTLTEVITVIIIIGALAGLAIPRYLVSVEKVKSAEGVQLLTELLGSERRYSLENSAYTTDITNLDFTTPSWGNFNQPAAADFGSTVVGNGGALVTITRNNNSNSFGNYTLTINETTGVVTCAGGSSSICTRMGF